eukprot:NODE_1113_length_1008_cov_82.813848_g1068_i0.p1 GENE.NODE_1113_length_1008_cov_82.813848_g1068_i0~~NODE_1113_length_1008_cov_82.813848_g1068_i0.p1  ORF type:complete len:283 (-),score=23.01 NODE_1113_length_1008_cov_82.813848_g1068_i0:96-944(-)
MGDSLPPKIEASLWKVLGWEGHTKILWQSTKGGSYSNVTVNMDYSECIVVLGRRADGALVAVINPCSILGALEFRDFPYGAVTWPNGEQGEPVFHSFRGNHHQYPEAETIGLGVLWGQKTGISFNQSKHGVFTTRKNGEAFEPAIQLGPADAQRLPLEDFNLVETTIVLVHLTTQTAAGSILMVDAATNPGAAPTPSEKSAEEALAGAQAVDAGDTSTEGKVFPYAELKTPSKLDSTVVDATAREKYLSEEEFSQLFHQSRDEFYALPKTEQSSIKRQLKLL